MPGRKNAVRRYASPAACGQLKPAEQLEFLRGLLELAHIRALRDDVAGALALLNWAEGRPDVHSWFLWILQKPGEVENDK